MYIWFNCQISNFQNINIFHLLNATKTNNKFNTTETTTKPKTTTKTTSTPKISTLTTTTKTTTTKSTNACTINPCLNGATCQVNGNGNTYMFVFVHQLILDQIVKYVSDLNLILI